MQEVVLEVMRIGRVIAVVSASHVEIIRGGIVMMSTMPILLAQGVSKYLQGLWRTTGAAIRGC